MEFVGPEHLAMAILSVGECGARRVLARWACHHHQCCAVTRELHLPSAWPQAAEWHRGKGILPLSTYKHKVNGVVLGNSS